MEATMPKVRVWIVFDDGDVHEWSGWVTLVEISDSSRLVIKIGRIIFQNGVNKESKRTEMGRYVSSSATDTSGNPIGGQSRSKYPDGIKKLALTYIHCEAASCRTFVGQSSHNCAL